MIQSKRIESLDLFRGMAMMLIILFHSSIYNYANIHKLDFSNPPIIVVIMSFMGLWGGVFIMYSMAVNAIMVLRRDPDGASFRNFLDLIIAGFIYILLHYVLNIFLGRWSIDFINNKPDLTFIAGSLRNLHLNFPHITKFFEGSSLSAVAVNLIVLSLVLFLLLRKKGVIKEKRNYFVLGISGSLIMLLSFIRVCIFRLLPQSIEDHNYLLSVIYSFIFANPYPLLPYLAYGIFGAMIGIMIHRERDKLLKVVITPIGIFFLIFGFIGMSKFEKTISTPDYFWYFKTNFELGIFILMLVLMILVFESKHNLLKKLSVIKWFSRITLTIYLFETTTSEIFRIAWLQISPSWNQTINGSLFFGCLNVVMWIVIVFFWRKIDFKYSLEYYWVRFFFTTGKISTKLDFL
jgi:surface polysaccharide O-acyltransferase-like enzyme